MQKVVSEWTGIYHRSVEGVLGRYRKFIEKSGGDFSNYDSLKKFSRDMKVGDGLSDHRIMFYLDKLRPLAEILQDDFLDPSADNLKEAIEEVARKGISPRSVEDYKQSMKKYYGWALSPSKYSRACGWIKIKNNTEHIKKSEEMLTESEYRNILAACRNPRDKAMVSLAYDSGCRIGEILSLRMRDLEIDDRGMMIHVTGKTNERKVYVIGDSIFYLREWRKLHPAVGDPDALIFVDLVNNLPMNYDAARLALSKATKRAGITKRVHAHLFRHSYATRYAEVLPEAVLKKQLGWSESSKMTAKYIHLSAQQQKNAIQLQHGYEPEVKGVKQDKPKACLRCGESNPSDAQTCMRCWFPLDTRAAAEAATKLAKVEKAVTSSGVVAEMVKNIIPALPAEAKVKLLSEVLAEIAKDPEIKEKFLDELRHTENSAKHE